MPDITRIPLSPKPAMALFTFGIIGYLGENLAPYFITAISSGLGVGSVTASSVTTTMFVATAVVGLLTGRFAANRHRRTLARLGLIVAAVGFAVAAITPWLWLMYVAVVLAGAGSGAVTATAGAVLAAFRNPDRVSGFSGLVNAAVTAAVLAALPLFGLVPMNVFAPLSIICASALAIVAWSPKTPAETLDENPETTKCTATSGRLTIVPGICLLILFPLWGMTESTVWAMASDMATEYVGLSATEAGAVFSVGEIAAFLGAGLLTVVGGKAGRSLPLAILLVASAGLKLVMGVSGSPGLWSVAFVVWDMVSAVAFLYFIAAAAGLDASGRWSAPMTAAYMTGTAISPIVGAGTVELLGFGGFSWILAVSGIVLLIPAVWLSRVSVRTERKSAGTTCRCNDHVSLPA